MKMEASVNVRVDERERALNHGRGGGGNGGSIDDSARKPTQHNRLSMQQYQQSQIGTLSQLLAGGLAGAFSKTCTAPLARLTILFQVQGMHSDVATLRKASLWNEASRIASEEGLRAFWKGNLVTIVHRIPYSAINFYFYERYKKVLLTIPWMENKSTYHGVHFVSGGLAGITAASATYPLDLIRTRLSAQTKDIYYRGIWHALLTVTREEGFQGLYKGLGATLLVYTIAVTMHFPFVALLTAVFTQGVGPSIAISFSVYESLKSFWQLHRPDDSTILVSLSCGSLSGIASSTVTFPIDLVRRRKQLEGSGGRARVYSTSLVGTFRRIIEAEGFFGLYRGILPEYYKVVPSVGICFMTYEALKIMLAQTSATI